MSPKIESILSNAAMWALYDPHRLIDALATVPLPRYIDRAFLRRCGEPGDVCEELRQRYLRLASLEALDMLRANAKRAVRRKRRLAA